MARKKRKKKISYEQIKKWQIEQCYNLFSYTQAFYKPIGFINFSSPDELNKAKKREDRAIERSEFLQYKYGAV